MNATKKIENFAASEIKSGKFGAIKGGSTPPKPIQLFPNSPRPTIMGGVHRPGTK